MHTLVGLVAVVAAEKSKVPFYVAGGVLVVWALIVALVLGLRKERFPYNLEGQRVVSAITALLVLGAVSTAVITAGGEGKSEAASATAPAEGAAPPPAPAQAPAQPPSTQAAPPAQQGTAKTSPAKPPAAPAVTKLALAADPGGQLVYDTKQLSAKAGSVTIDLTNASPVEHNVTIVQGTATIGATPTFTGGSKSVTVRLKPGTYTFYCSVPGHRQAGMEGTLKVS